MIEKAEELGDGWGGDCANYISTVLKTLGFKHALTPGGVENQLKESKKVTSVTTYRRERK